jgi:Uma2 family endonuclease
MTITLAKWSIDKYHNMVDAGILANRHVELLRGKIVEMAPLCTPHAHFSTVAGTYLVRLLGERAMVRQAKPITLPSSISEPEPDIAIVEDRGDEYLNHHPYPENIFWSIEFMCTNLEAKTKVYAETGISECWVVNLQEYTLETKLSSGTIYPKRFSRCGSIGKQNCY